MGIREIEDRNQMRELMRKKAAELRMKRLETKTEITKMTKDKLAEIAKKHGVIIALDPDMQEAVEEIRKKYNIPKERIIKEQITEESVLKRGKKVQFDRLGMLAYQRVMLEKQETGGLLTIPDIFDRVNTGVLQGNISMEDVEKAVKMLKKNKIIPEIRTLESGVLIASFFPVQYTKDQSRILNLVKDDGVINTGDVCKELNWTVERAERALQNLVDTRVARIMETFRTGKRYFFPSLKLKK
ncbi:MAG: hypothetical protein ACTSYI_07740 [Promethearchaeota archaeon]